MRLSTLAMVVFLPAIWPQSSTDRVTVGQPQKVAGKRSAAVTTKIPVSILPGFHVNSNKPKDEYLIPLAVTWKSLGALEGGQLMFPKPETIKVAGEDTLVFTGNIDVTASFKISDKAPGGPGIATGTLRYQACNDKACFPPKNIDFNVPYQVQ